MDEVPHLEAAARISVQTLMSSVNSLVGGMNQIREETQALRKVKNLPPNDLFIEVMEVTYRCANSIFTVFQLPPMVR